MIARSAAPLAATLLALACTTTRAPSFHEGCRDPARPCAFAYDFEPSGIARDPFSPGKQAYLVANEDAVVFRWSLEPKDAWDHDHVEFATYVGSVLTKVESAASATCDGVPVLLLASNFMPGRSGESRPEQQRVIALVGSLAAAPRVLEQVSALVGGIAALEGAARVKVEGLALAADCRTLYVGLRSVVTKGGEDALREEIFPIALDVDWAGGTREEAHLGKPIVLATKNTCSGRDEGISALEVLADGTLLALTSHEIERRGKSKPTDVPEGELAGSLWRRAPDGAVERLACFPGHKPEAVAVDDDGTIRVLMEDDEYGGRPIRAFAVTVPAK